MILVTGGTGYIGSHVCVALARAGHEFLILDNLSNSRREVLQRLARLCGSEPRFVEGDIRDPELLAELFTHHPISSVMHFAGLKAVGESVTQPLAYVDNNICGTTRLLLAMANAGIRSLVFSSSATVYGDPQRVPITEDALRSATNPYGRTKLVIEDILEDVRTSDPTWRIARLRYFNPVGADVSGLIGENPQGVPNNLMPFVAQVATGQRKFLNVWGNDYPTPDGTGVRDYIHVSDLADGHLAALNYLQDHAGLLTVNLGTGRGYSVLEVVAAFERASGRPVPYRMAPRRPGDIAACWADPANAQRLLGWKATRDLDTMCADAWRWQCAVGANHA